MYLPTPDLWLGIRDMFWHEEGCTIDRRKPLTQESARSKVERGSSNALGGPIGSRQAELFVACTSIYQRGGCVRALPKMLHCRQQLCKRQCLVGWLVGCPKSSTVGPNLTSLRPSVTAPLPAKINWIYFSMLCMRSDIGPDLAVFCTQRSGWAILSAFGQSFRWDLSKNFGCSFGFRL